MKKVVWTFGLILGAIITGNMLFMVSRVYNNPNFDGGNKVIGFTALIIVFSLVLVGIKRYRDNYRNGTISFGKAFMTGFYISLIASTMYVGVWLVDYYLFVPEFIDKYAECVVRGVQNDGGTQADVDKAAKNMVEFKKMYESPFFVIIATYAEVLPFGILLSLIGGVAFKRKPKNEEEI